MSENVAGICLARDSKPNSNKWIIEKCYVGPTGLCFVGGNIMGPAGTAHVHLPHCLRFTHTTTPFLLPLYSFLLCLSTLLLPSINFIY